MNFENQSREYRMFVEAYLKDIYTKFQEEPQKPLFEAMEYSLLAGGKRLRPIFAFDFCRMCGGDWKAAAPLAAAVEMIHTYSLIHDDLPCMDNDDFRRGRPTNHKVYGEALAILAGDGLLNCAFEAVTKDMMLYFDSPEKIKQRIKACNEIAKGAGCRGMIAGQVSDIEAENAPASSELLEYIHLNKTGALFTAAIKAGLYLGNATPDMLNDFSKYSENLGLAFQIADDILDVTGSTEELGKNTGSDQKQNKNTYITINGIEAARDRLNELTTNALNAIEHYYDNAEFFNNLVIELANRTK